MTQAELFSSPTLPDGLQHRSDFLSQPEESELLDRVRAIPLRAHQYQQWQAKRRIVSYGGSYDFTHQELHAAPPIPEFLYPLRERMARWAGLESADLQHAMIAEYSPNTQLGWHRDVPNFEQILGLSLLGSARMRLRPYPPKKGERSALILELAPRSAYILRGPARWAWQHAISPTKALRYSITFRTLRTQPERSVDRDTDSSRSPPRQEVNSAL